MRVQQSDVQRQLSRAFDLSGPIAVDLATTVSPTLIVGPTAPEPYGTTVSWQRDGNLTGAAGQTGYVSIICGVNSRNYVVVTDAQFGGDGGPAEYVLGLLYGSAATPVDTSPAGPTLPDTILDTRELINAVPPTSPTRIVASAAVSGPGLAGAEYIANTGFGPVKGDQAAMRVLRRPVVLTPNTALFLSPVALATKFWYGFAGYLVEIGAR